MTVENCIVIRNVLPKEQILHKAYGVFSLRILFDPEMQTIAWSCSEKFVGF